MITSECKFYSRNPIIQVQFVFKVQLFIVFYNCLLDAVLICFDDEEKELSFSYLFYFKFSDRLFAADLLCFFCVFKKKY